MSSLPAESVDNVLGLVFPAGVLVPYAGDPTIGLPAGWLYCDGSAVSRTVYSALFSAIGTHYGAGDGSTTFNLPDTRGRLIVARSPGGAIQVATIGESDGLPATERNIDHHHTFQGLGGSGASYYTSGSQTDNFTHQTSGDANNLDAPAWLVVGAMLIKT